jgi:hypothetical protein
MSVVRRSSMAALVCAGLAFTHAAPAAARTQAVAAGAPSGDPSTLRQFEHASKCVVTLGFGGDCDRNAPQPRAAKARVGSEAGAAAVPAADDPSTRRRFLHASRCLVTVGFSPGCDKDAPAPKAQKSAALTDDTSTRHQFVHAGRCLVTLGFSGDCDKK